MKNLKFAFSKILGFAFKIRLNFLGATISTGKIKSEVISLWISLHIRQINFIHFRVFTLEKSFPFFVGLRILSYKKAARSQFIESMNEPGLRNISQIWEFRFKPILYIGVFIMEV